jgi:hypothetical protein
VIRNQLSPEVISRIAQAKEDLAEAEKELESALRQLQVEERADKKMISKVLLVAFDKLAAARTTLEELLESAK